MTVKTSADEPLPVRTVARMIAAWIERLGAVWVEGQIAQISRRPGTRTTFLTLRDPAAEVSLSVTAASALTDGIDLHEGDRIVVHAKPDFYLTRGTISLYAREIRPVGIGELLARLERLKRLLAAEGLFAADGKRGIPFLPGTVGLITGRASAAERDVLRIATERWPAVRFRVENVAVQGPMSVPQIVAALQRLDADRAVDVIVLARGGGSVEDLLPWSDETLCRAVAAALTPVVSAIGHEPDSPLVDFVADVRASTPTDAAKRIVPAVVEELAALTDRRDRVRRSMFRRLGLGQDALASLRARPVLADPARRVIEGRKALDGVRDRLDRGVLHRLEVAGADLGHHRARVTALSPAATLERGYAVVQGESGTVIRDPGDVDRGARVRIRLAHGMLGATVDGATQVIGSDTDGEGTGS